jgi:hypothetical protein
MTDPSYREWQGMSGSQRADAINRDPNLAYRMQAAQGQSSTDSASPFRFEDPNNPNPAPTNFYTPSENPGGYLNSAEHRNKMSRAYNSSNYDYSSIPGYDGWDYPGKEEDQLRRYLAGLGGKNDNNSNYNAAAAAAAAAAAKKAMIDAINQSYDTRKGGIDQQKTQATGNLQNILGSFRTDVQNNQASYMQGSESIQKAMAERAAQAQAEASTRSGDIQAMLAGQGGNASAINAQAMANQSVANQSGQAQKDLSQRFDQISQSNQKNVLNSGDLVQQGAAGQLQNQYTDLINALELSRQQEIYNAENPQPSGGGGGGGGRDSSTAADRKADREQGIVDSAFISGGSGSLMGALFAVNKEYAADIRNSDYDESVWADYGSEAAYKDALVREALLPYVSQEAYEQGNFERSMDERFAGRSGRMR